MSKPRPPAPNSCEISRSYLSPGTAEFLHEFVGCIETHPRTPLNHHEETGAMKSVALLVLAVVAILPPPLMADDTLVKFQGGIAVDPASTVGTPNVVRGVNPPGQLWRINALRAEVKIDGSIEVDGRGLLLAGGNSIGTTANLKVFATLICEPAAPFTEHSTNAAGVPLEPDGDFRIDDILSPIPAGCASPVLLIRNTANRAWFAAGIQKLD
jgi:hypothetical protein